MKPPDEFANIRHMPRVTLEIDARVLRDLKRLQEREGKPLGLLVSQLLSGALVEVEPALDVEPVTWTSVRMGQPKIDLESREALRTALDGP